jgi:hypothetical protein
LPVDPEDEERANRQLSEWFAMEEREGIPFRYVHHDD